MWSSTCTFLGCTPGPALFLRDDSDADDAYDAVLRISLYYIPDLASLASSASFGFRVFRSIIVFSFFNGKPQASFCYTRDGGDDGDGLSCIPLPISHKHRHHRQHRHQNRQAVLICGLPVLILMKIFVGHRSNLAFDHLPHISRRDFSCIPHWQ